MLRFRPFMVSVSLASTVLAVAIAFSSCGDARGTRMRAGEGELFYADGFPEPEARALMEFLRDSLRFFSDRPITVLIDRQVTVGTDETESYVLKMVCENGVENDADTRKSALAVARMVSEQVFSDLPVHFVFVNDRMEATGNVPFTRAGKRVRVGGMTVYAADGVGKPLAEAFGQKALQQPFLSREAIFRLSKDSVFHVGYLAAPDELGSTEFKEQLSAFVLDCALLFGESSAVRLHLTDYVFDPLETIRLTPF